MRRSRLDIRLGRKLSIGQQWWQRDAADDRAWRVRQVHRVDGLVELERVDERICVRFSTLRRDWATLVEVSG